MNAARPAWNPADPVTTWLAIGEANRWISRACDPPFTRNCFVECADAAELVERLAHGNWCLGQAFFLGDLCFIQQVGGGGGGGVPCLVGDNGINCSGSRPGRERTEPQKELARAGGLPGLLWPNGRLGFGGVSPDPIAD